MRVDQFLSDQHIAFETTVHAPAYTSQRRARYLHVPGRQVAKSVLLAGPTDFVLAVLAATHQIDLPAVCKALGYPLRLANHLEIADLFRDCEWGALTPFGNLYGLVTIVDESLDLDAQIIFEAQMHAVTISMNYRDFERLEHPRRFHFAYRLDKKPASPSDPSE
jgi:Ala-tRNA(Pro) deacylase